MAYFLSYIVFTEAHKKMGHASLAITEHTPPGEPNIIFRIGLLRPSQVQLEDFIKHKKGREFFHVTFPISEQELNNFFITVNDDRRQKTSNQNVRQEDNVSGSTPGGPKHDWVTFNCKTYALSVMGKVGIKESSLENFGVDLPIFSGKMQPLHFKNNDKRDKVLIWDCPFVVSDRTSYENFTPAELEALRARNLANNVTDIYNEAKKALLEEKQRLLLTEYKLKNASIMNSESKTVKTIQTRLSSLDKAIKILDEKSLDAKGVITLLKDTSSKMTSTGHYLGYFGRLFFNSQGKKNIQRVEKVLEKKYIIRPK